MPSRTFERFAGAAAIAAGVGGVAYSIAFVTLLRRPSKVAGELTALFLLLGGLLGTAVIVALYRRVRDTDPAFATWALVLGLAGAFGSAIHGGYDLAVAVKVEGQAVALTVNPVDPRGLLTFGVSALAVLVFSWLIREGGRLPGGLASLGFAAGILLVILYVGRLIILNPKNPLLLVTAVLSGFLVNPIWYVWLGTELRRQPDPGAVGRPAGTTTAAG